MRWTNSLRRALRRVEQVAGEPVTYRRGDVSATIIATRAERATDAADTGNASSLQVSRQDWILTELGITLPTGQITPMEGDELVDSRGVIYRVTKRPGDGKAARAIRHGVGVRLHTVIVEGQKT